MDSMVFSTTQDQNLDNSQAIIDHIFIIRQISTLFIFVAPTQYQNWFPPFYSNEQWRNPRKGHPRCIYTTSFGSLRLCLSHDGQYIIFPGTNMSAFSITSKVSNQLVPVGRTWINRPRESLWWLRMPHVPYLIARNLASLCLLFMQSACENRFILTLSHHWGSVRRSKRTKKLCSGTLYRKPSSAPPRCGIALCKGSTTKLPGQCR
jgi:hypothetical protein